MVEKTARYWHWWVISFFLLTFLCCLLSCGLGAITVDTDSVRQSVLKNSPESSEGAMFGAWIGASFWWWIFGMCGVTFITLIIIILTLALAKTT
jgi:hypothetical protein